MAVNVDINFLSVVFLIQALVTVICVFHAYKCMKYFFGKTRSEQPRKHDLLRRRLGYMEDLFEVFYEKAGGSGNICVVIRLTSKQRLSHQHVRDALVMLVKRQPMLRAFIRTMENGDRYFEIQKINEILSMIDFSSSDVKASNWQDIWFEQTAKQMRNDLLWRVVVLQEECVSNSGDHANTLMFTFRHSCIDGISSVKFCKQFLKYLNEFSNGASCVDQEVSSLNLQPYSHDVVTRKGILYPLLNFMLSSSGLRPIFRYYMQRVFATLFQAKPYNPYYTQFPPSLDVSRFAGPIKLDIQIFTADETKNIIQACRENNCTVTGALTAAAHLAFCQLIEDGLAKDKDVKLQHDIVVNARRFWDSKLPEDYLGCFVYVFEEFYMKYTPNTDEFWKVAQIATRGIRDLVKDEKFITNETFTGKTMKPDELVNALTREAVLRLSDCNIVSSVGSFNLNENEEQQTYKLHEFFMNIVDQGFPRTFAHFNHTINGKMTWQITSNMSRVDISHAEKFVSLCFGKCLEIARGGI